MESTPLDHSGAEGVAADAQDNVYGAVVRRQMRERHVRRSRSAHCGTTTRQLLLDRPKRIEPHTGSGGE
jgi:hypothetical protein